MFYLNKKVSIISTRVSSNSCGVGDYTEQLAAFLSRDGYEVSVVTSKDNRFECRGVTLKRVVTKWSCSQVIKIVRAVKNSNSDFAVLQFEPFLYGRKFGLNFFLPILLLLLRVRKIKVVLMAHEMWVPMWYGAWHLRGFWFFVSLIQRVLLASSVMNAFAVFVSYREGAHSLKQIVPWKQKKILHVPVSSNIVVLENVGGDLRDAYGVNEASVVLSCFSPLGSGKLPGVVASTWNEVQKTLPGVYFFLIGLTQVEAMNSPLSILDKERCFFSGYLSPLSVSKWLQASDVFFGPFVDGITTRRGSTMAAMSHGLPVVSNLGPLSEREIFEESPVQLVSPEVKEFANAVRSLSADKTRREEIGAKTKVFYEENFSWERVIERYVEVFNVSR